MSGRNDGGPAFANNHQDGMTLRDWFAGQALAGLCVGHKHDAGSLSRLSYERADAMLAARNAEASK